MLRTRSFSERDEGVQRRSAGSERDGGLPRTRSASQRGQDLMVAPALPAAPSRKRVRFNPMVQVQGESGYRLPSLRVEQTAELLAAVHRTASPRRALFPSVDPLVTALRARGARSWDDRSASGVPPLCIEPSCDEEPLSPPVPTCGRLWHWLSYWTDGLQFEHM